MLKIGLTGGIASGKSTVARMFSELGAQLIDADALAREAVAKGSRGLARIRERFGDEVILPDGGLDRAAMREIIFSDPKAREDLNNIVHPQVRRLTAKRLGEIQARDPQAIVLVDVPLLFETGSQDQYRAVVLVYVPQEVQISRLMKRDGVDRKQALAALAAQMPLSEKKGKVQFLVDNSGPLEETRSEVGEAWRQLVRLASPRLQPEINP